MSISANQENHGDKEVDLLQLLSVVLSSWRQVFLVVALGTMLSTGLAVYLKNSYTATAIYAPTDQSGSSVDRLMQQYSGLASLAGMSLPSAEDSSRASLGIQLMTSRKFIGDFIERRGLMPILMAADSWDPLTQLLSYDQNDYLPDSKEWVRDVDPPRTPEPSRLEGYEEFMSILTVSEDRETGYVTVAINHLSPVVAADLVTWLVSDVNELVKNQDVLEAEKSIEYLHEQVKNTALSELRVGFFELIQSQTETIMLAEVRPEYVFKVIDPAVAPEEHSWPNRLLIVLAGFILSFLSAAIFVLTRYSLKEGAA
jgi:uncharacterized protein involved in exopolysaccharide biosynthesis